MSSLLEHLLLFAAVAFAIALMGSFYAEPDDARALRSLPRRYALFLFGCALVVLVLLGAERLFAG